MKSVKQWIQTSPHIDWWCENDETYVYCESNGDVWIQDNGGFQKLTPYGENYTNETRTYLVVVDKVNKQFKIEKQ